MYGSIRFYCCFVVAFWDLLFLSWKQLFFIFLDKNELKAINFEFIYINFAKYKLSKIKLYLISKFIYNKIVLSYNINEAIFALPIW